MVMVMASKSYYQNENNTLTGLDTKLKDLVNKMKNINSDYKADYDLWYYKMVMGAANAAVSKIVNSFFLISSSS